jgi:DNA-binding MarR family transcriptional regulator
MSDDRRPDRIRLCLDAHAALGSIYRRVLGRMFALDPYEMAAVSHLARGEMTAGQLSYALVLSVEEVVALIDGLEEAGHVIRHPHAEDPELVGVALSESTRSRLTEARRTADDRFEAAFAELTSDERERIGRYLEDVTLITEREADALARGALEGEGRLGHARRGDA